MTAVTAGMSGRCALCDEPIHVGDPIVLVDDEWAHVLCEEEQA